MGGFLPFIGQYLYPGKQLNMCENCNFSYLSAFCLSVQAWGTCHQSCFLWGDVWCQGRGSCFTALSCYRQGSGRLSFMAWGDKKNLRQPFVCTFRCSDSTRPETLRPCSLPCKKDCIVTPFSEWTACPSTCVPGSSLISMNSVMPLLQLCLLESCWHKPMRTKLQVILEVVAQLKWHVTVQ